MALGLSGLTLTQSVVATNGSNHSFFGVQSTKFHMENIADGGCVTIKQRQDITRITVHKLMATYGSYPTKEQCRKVAVLLADLLGLERHIFYDEVTHDGFLVRGLENARRRLARQYGHY